MAQDTQALESKHLPSNVVVLLKPGWGPSRAAFYAGTLLIGSAATRGASLLRARRYLRLWGALPTLPRG